MNKSSPNWQKWSFFAAVFFGILSLVTWLFPSPSLPMSTLRKLLLAVLAVAAILSGVFFGYKARYRAISTWKAYIQPNLRMLLVALSFMALIWIQYQVAKDFLIVTLLIGEIAFTIFVLKFPPKVILPKRECARPVVVQFPLPFTSGTEADEFQDASGQWKKAAVYAECHPAWKRAKQLEEDGAQWIWIREQVTKKEAEDGGEVFHRRQFHLEESYLDMGRRVELIIDADDEAVIKVNQQEIGETVNETKKFDITSYVKQGRNLLNITLKNHRHGPGATPQFNPTGVIYRIVVS